MGGGGGGRWVRSSVLRREEGERNEGKEEERRKRGHGKGGRGWKDPFRSFVERDPSSHSRRALNSWREGAPPWTQACHLRLWARQRHVSRGPAEYSVVWYAILGRDRPLAVLPPLGDLVVILLRAPSKASSVPEHIAYQSWRYAVLGHPQEPLAYPSNGESSVLLRRGACLGIASGTLKSLTKRLGFIRRFISTSPRAPSRAYG